MARGPWTDGENDLIVGDYFAMLAADLAGGSCSKAEHNRVLQAQINRSSGSIEYKHRNISAVLKGLGESWILGYLPAFNFQSSLADAVVRWLDSNPDWLPSAQAPSSAGAPMHANLLPISPPPTLSNQPPPGELDQMLNLSQRFDSAGRAERNRSLGRAGEQRVLAHERATLADAGRADLAERVAWVAQEQGDGAGYDIASFSAEGQPRLVEVKTTNGWERTPFYISRNELEVSRQRSAEWCLMRLWNFARAPRAFELRPPLEFHVSLIATNYEAAFR